MNRVFAVVVTHQPDARTGACVRALEPQLATVILVDNGSTSDRLKALEALRTEKVRLLALGQNLGIGAAHNAGIAAARESDATHVLLMDQDSVAAPDMVRRLLEAEAILLAKGENVGALGPAYHDARLSKTWPFYRMSRFGVRPRDCAGEETVACDFLISSGTLARNSVLDEVGGMNEDYFLEHVDTEWSLRVRHRGYRLFGVCAARMDHTLGDQTIAVPGLGRSVQLYQPYRHYYLFRNALLLWRERYAPLPWKLNEVQRLLKRLLFFSLFAPPRAERLYFMLLGLWHGSLGRTGPLRR